MEKLLSKIVSKYKEELTFVIHRTLDFKKGEIEGAQSALNSIDTNMVHIVENPDERVLGEYDTRRGAFLYEVNGRKGWVYTTGCSKTDKMYLV